MADNEELDLSWIKLPDLDKEQIIQRADLDLYFRRNFCKNKTKEFEEKLKYQEEMGQNIILNYYGLGGSGKSYTAIYHAGLMAKFGETEFTPDLIFFRLEELDRYLPNLKNHDKIVVDERVPVFGVGTKRLEMEYTLMMETLRKKQVSFFLVAFEPRTPEYCPFLVQSLRLSDFQTKSIVELQNNNMETMGHLEIPHPKFLLGSSFMEEYEAKKDMFLESVKKKSKGDYLTYMAEEVIKDVNFQFIENEYKKKANETKREFRGMPQRILLEIVNAKFPELRRNIEAKTIANKIMQIKILRGEWKV